MMFRWIVDAEGDIGLEIAWGLLTLIKYKSHVMSVWFRKHEDAPTYTYWR